MPQHFIRCTKSNVFLVAGKTISSQEKNPETFHTNQPTEADCSQLLAHVGISWFSSSSFHTMYEECGSLISLVQKVHRDNFRRELAHYKKIKINN